ncbi:MAG: AAA family ATPase [Bacteroidota bacterium]
MIEAGARIHNYLLSLEDLTPVEIVRQVRMMGYVGQEKAVKSLSLMACRHVKRLASVFLEGISQDELPSKDNYLLLGPTGCGKTHLIRLIFEKILQLPTAIIDITSYSETGYIGQDVVSILTRLVHAADGDYELASIGIVCLDEFDKLSSGKNNAVFSGQGTTKDVSGLGVQRELLKMLEGAEIDVPIELTHSSYSPRATMETDFISFVALGAFSGITKTIQHYNQQIGFGKKESKGQEQRNEIAYRLTEEEVRKTSYFQNYGIMPELIGRFTRIIPFHPLDKENLKQILLDNLMSQYEKELRMIHVSLEIEEAVMDKITEEALERETGARGLKSSLYSYIEDACFDLYSTPSTKKRIIHLYIEGGDIQWGIKS